MSEEQFDLQNEFNKAQDATQRINQETVNMLTDEEACNVATSMINFGNSHLVAHKLAVNAPDTARALLDELLYYRKQKRI